MKKDENNGRVTLAVLQRDIKHLSEKIDSYFERNNQVIDNHENRLSTLEKAVAQSKGFFIALSAIIALLTVINFLIRIWQ